MALTAAFTGAGSLLISAVALCFFGSVGSALEYFMGNRLIVLNGPSRSFGETEEGRHPAVVFEIWNASGQEVSLLGSKTRCSCVVAQELPVSIPPGTRRPIGITIKTESKAGPFEEFVSFFTDFPTQPKLELRVVGRVLSAGGQVARSNSRWGYESMTLPTQSSELTETDQTAECASQRGDPVNDVASGRTCVLRLVHRTSLGFSLAAVLLLGAGAASFFLGAAPNDQVENLRIEPPSQSFGDVPSGTRPTLTFGLTNRSRRAIKVVGSTRTCCPHGCLTAENLPLEIPARSVGQLVVRVGTGTPGPFACELAIFTDSPGQPRIPLDVTGLVTDARENP
jgi:Protein of unknown function (DUF1573)